MKNLLRFVTADVRMTRRTEITLRYLILGLLVALAGCFLMIWIPLIRYDQVTILEPNILIRWVEVGLFSSAITLALWMAVFYARRMRG